MLDETLAAQNGMAARMELDFEKDPSVLAALAREPGLGVFSVDGRGRFVGWSAGASELTGHSAEELRGKPCGFLDGEHCKGFGGLMDLLTSANAPSAVDPDFLRDHECRIVTSGGRELHVLSSAVLLRDEDGGIHGAVGTFVDLTAVLEANAPARAKPLVVGVGGLVSTSSAMQDVFRRIRLAADSDVTTLITGESGTGKELAARAIHSLGERAAGPFVAVNCSAIAESLLESELFGHVKGAFTGAIRDRAGVIEEASGGTLFLDEIGEVSPLLQVKLLRVLQEREVRRVGGERSIPVDVRVLSATNRDLEERIAAGQLREDFYYRIRVFDVHMPALRERPSDISVLAQHFAEEIARRTGKAVNGIAQDALGALVRYPWPGNVRELRNAIEHATVVRSGDQISLLDLPTAVRDYRGTRAVSTRGAAPIAVDALTPDQEAERLRILAALDANGWNRTRTAESLGFSRVTLWKKIRRYSIDEGVFKRGTRDEL